MSSTRSSKTSTPVANPPKSAPSSSASAKSASKSHIKTPAKKDEPPVKASAAAAASGSGGKFVEGEKILCFHGPLIYEAKIQKCQERDHQMKYFIHYHGWNKNWDEWVR